MNKKIKQSLAIVTSAALAFSAVVASSANAAGKEILLLQEQLLQELALTRRSLVLLVLLTQVQLSHHFLITRLVD